jgi:hypothetical protein
MMTLAPTSFTALKMALAVPGTPAIPVLHHLIIKELRKKNIYIEVYQRIEK